MLPNFLVCGVQKAATTSLHAYLRKHPQIYLPQIKELNYFNLNWEKPRDWYENHFSGWAGQPAVGEVSPLYLWDESVAKRISQTLSNPRLIFLLRNPIDRAYSNYWFNVSRGAQNPKQSFSDAVRTSEGEWRYLDKGLYNYQLSRYVSVFPRQRLLILFAEELRARRQQVLDEIYSFLAVDSWTDNTAFMERHNITRLPATPWIAKLWSLWLEHRNLARALVPGALAHWSRWARRSLHSLMFVPKSPPPMSGADRHYLRKWYAQDVAALTQLLRRSPPWEDDFGKDGAD